MRQLKELAIVALVSCVTLATAHAYTEEEEVQFEALAARWSDITQGTEVDGATITAKGGSILEGEDACLFSRLLNADDVCEISAIVVPPEDVGIDTIYYSAPENIGHVNMDD